jgi:uncharacterized LabA/DUF88 family protein
MMTRPRPHVFLSHVREDAGRVERLAAGLEARGIGAWIDRHQIRPGQRWQQAIEDAIRSGSFFVACFSQAYSARTRSYMNEELLVAIEEVRLRPEAASWFIPVRLDECAIPDRRIGPGLSIGSFQRLDMFPDWDKSLERLAQTIGPSAAARTAVLIDGDWLLSAARQARLRIDYALLLMRMRECFGDDVSVSFQMTARGAQGTRFMTRLERLGYELVEAERGGRSIDGGSNDLRLALCAVEAASGTLVIVSGDAALAPLIEHARQQGRTTILIGLPGAVSPALKGAADRFVDLGEFVRPG